MTGFNKGHHGCVKVRCENCARTSNVQSCYRLDPTNWHRDIRRLCTPCRSKLGFVVLDYGRKAVAWC